MIFLLDDDDNDDVEVVGSVDVASIDGGEFPITAILLLSV